MIFCKNFYIWDNLINYNIKIKKNIQTLSKSSSENERLQQELQEAQLKTKSKLYSDNVVFFAKSFRTRVKKRKNCILY